MNYVAESRALVGTRPLLLAAAGVLHPKPRRASVAPATHRRSFVGYSWRQHGDWKTYTSMLEKPELSDEKLIACLQDAYELLVVQVTFLPLGADPNTAVYRVVTEMGTSYFLKLRRGLFDERRWRYPNCLATKASGKSLRRWQPKSGNFGQVWTRSR